MSRQATTSNSYTAKPPAKPKPKPKPKSKPAPQPKMTRAQQLVSEVNTKAFQEAMADIEAGRTPGQGRPKPAPKSSTRMHCQLRLIRDSLGLDPGSREST